MKIFILLLSAFFSFTAVAQKYTIKAAEEACDCFSKIETGPDSLTKADLTSYSIKCTGSAIINYYEKICKENKIDADKSPDSYRQVGYALGLQLGATCSKFTEMTLKMKKNDFESLGKEKPKSVSAETMLSSSGIIKKIETRDFVYITIENASQSNEVFVWLRTFPGSTAFENNLDGQTGKQVTISYKEIRCY